MGIICCAGDVASGDGRRIGANAGDFNGGKSASKVRENLVAMKFSV